MADANSEIDKLVDQARVTNVLLVEIMQKQFDLKQADLISRLAAAGTPKAEIAQILGTSINTVHVTLSRDKKKKQKK